MKKIIILICLMMLSTGCTISEISMKNIDNMIDISLNEKTNLYNRMSKGYKYYLPKGMSLLDYKDYNETIYSNLNKYYLYVDVVSYHYKSQKTYRENAYAYYSKIITDDKGKLGYIEVNKKDNKYYIVYEYNYAKMETVVNLEEIETSILNMSYILSSISYNDVIIHSIVGENVLNFSEEKYQIKKPTETENTFLDYVNAYDKYNGEESVEDNDTIKQNNSDEKKEN